MKQELIFLWINNYGCWQKTGVNFSPNYFVSFNHETSILSIQKNDNINIFLDDNIMNLSAVIGENGTGKTTLLDFCNSLSDTPFTKFTDEEYYAFQNEQNGKNSFISVYLINNVLRIINKTDNNIYYKDSMISPITQDGFSDNILSKTTHIYFTNSEYANDTNLFQNGIDHISIHNKALNHVARSFYKHTVLNGKQFYISNELPFDNIQSFIIHNKTIENFQQIIDVIFLYKIYKNGRENDYLGKHIQNINFTFTSIIDLIYGYIINNKNNEAQIDNLRLNFEYFQKIINKYNQGQNIIDIIIINLAFELHYLYEFDCEECELNVLFQNCIDFIENNIINQIEHNYYKNAIKEIKQVIRLTQSCTIIENSLPKKDLGHQKRYAVSVNALGRILSNILINRHASFIAKYIVIDGLKISSGERALLNFSSRIELLSYFSSIFGISYKLRENILFLFDEIDLYVHPNAQRKLIDSLLKQLKNLFKGYNVQVIISSHSPIVLSDIPREHVTYLQKGKNGNVVVLDGRDKPQTFAANIPSLYRNSFFIDGGVGIGEYALTTINSIAKKLCNHEEIWDDELNNYKKKISIIGEPVLKKKLEEMLYIYCGEQGAERCRYYENDNSERERYLSFLRQQRSLIDSEIKRIEGERHD